MHNINNNRYHNRFKPQPSNPFDSPLASRLAKLIFTPKRETKTERISTQISHQSRDEHTELVGRKKVIERRKQFMIREKKQKLRKNVLCREKYERQINKGFIMLRQQKGEEVGKEWKEFCAWESS